MTDDRAIDHQPWPMRPYILLGLGALAGLLVYLLVDTGPTGPETEDPLRLGAAASVAVGSAAFAFSLERLRWSWSAVFALAAGLVVGFVTFWNGSPGGWGPGEGWRFAASFLSVALAVPLFQAYRDSGSRRLDPRTVHEHVWTNVILWCLAWAFVIAVWLLANMLAALFDLIGLEWLERLLRREWVVPVLFGGAFGAAVGMLRDRDAVLVTLQRVGRTILSVLAPALAVGLVLFVLALPFTGLGPLWRETKATTPILLACMFGAFVLANAVIGHGADEEAKARLLRWSAMALGAVMLPLAIVAAISMSKRIGQYGFTPDRLWALVIVAVAIAVAGAYLVALVRRRGAWAPHIRTTNVALAAGVSLLALFLALPIVSFGAVSARNQLAMLESGKVPPDRFDWRAMRFDFGPSGLRALERLRDKGMTPDIRARALAALAASDRWALDGPDAIGRERKALAAIRILPQTVPMPASLRNAVADSRQCAESGLCLLLYRPGEKEAVLVEPSNCIGRDLDSWQVENTACEPEVEVYYEHKGKWSDEEPSDRRVPQAAGEAGLRQARALADLEALKANRAEIRPVTRRQVFVDGKPVGDAFE
ncbi:MAG TPA: DUF4153 domain-containing protein [Allosphingosinicella sp.]